jgi:hypothetical protein
MSYSHIPSYCVGWRQCGLFSWLDPNWHCGLSKQEQSGQLLLVSQSNHVLQISDFSSFQASLDKDYSQKQIVYCQSTRQKCKLDQRHFAEFLHVTFFYITEYRQHLCFWVHIKTSLQAFMEVLHPAPCFLQVSCNSL